MRIYFVTFLLFISFVASGQILEGHKFEVGVGAGFATSSNMPFWLRANQYSEVPFDSNYGTFFATFEKLEPIKEKKIALDYKITARTNFGSSSQFLLPEAYLGIKLGAFKIYTGRKKEIQGLIDSTLSSGSFIWSGNALPLPKLDISIPEYTPILFKGLISIKGNYAHGWFGSTDSVKNYFLHQKSFYTRIGKPTWKLKFYSGFNHQVQWGGAPAIPFVNNGNTISKYGSDLNTYVNVVTGASLNKNGDGDESDGALNESLNRAGNHLGTLDVAVGWEDSSMNILLYKQSFYDDGSLYYLSNISDGLYGLSIKNKNEKSFFKKVVFEFFDSRNQGGSIKVSNINELRGLDNYFNNPIYKDGWEYKANTIGSPYIIRAGDLKEIVGNKNIFDSNKIINRVEAVFCGIEFGTKKLQLTTKTSFSSSYGTPTLVLGKINQFSIAQNYKFMLSNIKTDVFIGADFGELWKNTLGMRVNFKKEF